MNPGDTIPNSEWVARAVIFPTHLPQQQLSPEALFDFRGLDPEKDAQFFADWAHAYAVSVSCLHAGEDKVHKDGLELARQQNENRPLPESPESAKFGHMRAYLGFYRFLAGAVAPLDNHEQIETIFWPEGTFDNHANYIVRLAECVNRRDRTKRRTRITGLLWRALSGPVRYLHSDDTPHANYFNEVPLDALPA